MDDNMIKYTAELAELIMQRNKGRITEREYNLKVKKLQDKRKNDDNDNNEDSLQTVRTEIRPFPYDPNIKVIKMDPKEARKYLPKHFDKTLKYTMEHVIIKTAYEKGLLTGEEYMVIDVKIKDLLRKSKGEADEW